LRPRGILRGTAGIAEWFRPDGVAYAPAPAPEPAVSTPQPAYSPPRSPNGDGAAVLFAILGVGGLGAGVLGLSAYARNRPRNCEQCGTRMARLDEASDDVYLDSGQKMEEFLQSVDYDVWKCGGCGNHQLLPYPTLFSGKSACPSCRYRTVSTTRTVLEQPTYDWGGREEVIRDCRQCGFHDSQIVHLPQLTRPTHHHHSSSSGGSSFSSSSSSSSSSGGGFSSGGGASGSW
jgi:uncharacterized protein